MSNVTQISRHSAFLSFARSDQLWAPTVTGDYAADCDTGRRYGRELIRYVEMIGYPGMLVHIIAAMGGRPQTGVEVGFLTELGIRLTLSIEAADLESIAA